MYIGIDIGGTKLAVCLGDENLNIVKKKRYLHNHKLSAEENCEIMLNGIYEMISELELSLVDITSVGISGGGPLDYREGCFFYPEHMPKWSRFNVVAFFKEKLKIDTYILNDANACALAEWKYGAGKGFSNIVFLTMGTGLGAGIILNNALYQGGCGMAGEIGNWRIANTGVTMRGKVGCVESFCSGAGILANAKQKYSQLQESEKQKTHLKDIDTVTTKDIFALSAQGDEFCQTIVSEVAVMLGKTLSLIIDFLNPDAIIIGSIYVRVQSQLETLVKDVIAQEALDITHTHCMILPAQLNENVGDVAALMVAESKIQ